MKKITDSVGLSRAPEMALAAHAGSSRGTRVIFANRRITPVGENRWPTSIARVSAVRELWTAAIKSADDITTLTTEAVTPAELGGTTEESR